MKIDIIKNLIIKYFIANGNATNNDLAKEFSLSVPTVSKIIAEMTAEGTVNEFGKLRRERAGILISMVLIPTAAIFVGVDTLPDSVSLGLMNFRGDLCGLSMNVPFKIENNEESLEALCKMVRDFIDGLDVNKKKVLAVCVNISGV